jgi:hypothetical protein
MQISQWIKSKEQDWNTGLALYVAYSPNQKLRQLFEHGPSNFNKRKLLKELTELAQQLESKQALKFQKTETVTATAKAYARTVDEVPDVLKPIVELRITTYKTLSLLHNKLCELTLEEMNNPRKKRNYNEERFAIQQELLALDETNEQCWAKIHYFNEHGKLPEETTDEFIIANKTIRELVNLEKAIPSYISKNNSECKKEGISEERYQELVKRNINWNLQKAEIQKALDELPKFGKLKEVLHAKD